MQDSTNKTVIEVHDLTVSYRHKPVLWTIDFKIPEGSLAAVVGPNGAGKSTLLKSIMGLLPVSNGYVEIFSRPVAQSRTLIAYVPQKEEVDWDFPISVREVVLMGRYGRLAWYQKLSKSDYQAADQALEKVDMLKFADRQISQLSGGQQQRVFIARALAQQAMIYLMDEPFAGVDAATEKSIANLFKELKASGKTVICVHHDLNTVIDYFDYCVLVNMRLVAAGTTQQVFTAANLNETYGGRLGLLSEVAERMRQQKWEKRS